MVQTLGGGTALKYFSWNVTVGGSLLALEHRQYLVATFKDLPFAASAFPLANLNLF
jgi:hypothetical protein